MSFDQPSSPVDGLAGYDLEGKAKRLYVAPLAAVLRAKRLTSLVPLLPFGKGDVPGHEFHGNQYTGGQGGISRVADKEERAKLLDEVSHLSRNAPDGATAGKQWRAAYEMGRAIGSSAKVAVIRQDGLKAAVAWKTSKEALHITHLGSQLQGSGSALMAHVEAEADKSGKKTTLFADPSAKNFYEARGYKPAGGVFHGSNNLLMERLPKAQKGDVPGHKFNVSEIAKPKGSYDYSRAHKADCACGHTSLIGLRKRAPMPPTKRYVLDHEGKVAKALKSSFTRFGKKLAAQLSKKLPAPKKADLRHLLHKAETPEEMVDRILKELDLDGYGVAVYDDLHDEILKAFEEGGYSGAKMIGMANEKELLNQVSDEAVAFSKERAAMLVGKRIAEDGSLVDNPNPDYAITETTRDGLRSLVTDAIEEGWGAGELEDAILDSYFFSDARAETIARTELAYAHTQGNLQAWEDSGVVGGKSSLLADTHPAPDVCDEAADEGVIGMDEQFLDEYDGPPYHPNCLCALVPTLQSEQSDDEE